MRGRYAEGRHQADGAAAGQVLAGAAGVTKVDLAKMVAMHGELVGLFGEEAAEARGMA